MFFVSALNDEEEDTYDDNPVQLFNEGAWLVLPSGARIGHRSLARYFRQSLRPVNDETTGASIQGSRGKLHGKIISVNGGCHLIFNYFDIAGYCIIAIFVLICMIVNEIVTQIIVLVHATKGSITIRPF